MTTLLALPPTAAKDSAAPVSSKTVPAYAHSLRRGRPGASRAAAASSLQSPRMERRYVG